MVPVTKEELERELLKYYENLSIHVMQFKRFCENAGDNVLPIMSLLGLAGEVEIYCRILVRQLERSRADSNQIEKLKADEQKMLIEATAAMKEGRSTLKQLAERRP
jgi:hypothetical protein